MARFWIHSDNCSIYMIAEPSTGEPERWASMEAVPHIAEIPDDLRRRYERVMPEFWAVQQELEKLYHGGTPANAVRPDPK